MQKLSLDESLNSQSSSADQAVYSPVDAKNSFSENRVVETAGGTLRPQVKPNSTSMRNKAFVPVLVLVLIALAAGVATGYGGFKLKSRGGVSLGAPLSEQPIQQVATGSIKAGDVFGVQDASTFKDSAEGYLEEGGIGGEGSHKLLREGGVSQTVVLTSSVTDLSKFVGMQVKVGGETFKAQKAGWLMDVGRVEVIDPQGKAPSGTEPAETGAAEEGGD